LGVLCRLGLQCRKLNARPARERSQRFMAAIDELSCSQAATF
jgi:hypothetical protein